MKNIMIKFFAWLIELKLSKRANDDRIIFLANKLMDEAERQGYDLKAGNIDLKYIDIHHHSTGTLEIMNKLSKTPMSIRSTRQYMDGTR